MQAIRKCSLIYNLNQSRFLRRCTYFSRMQLPLVLAKPSKSKFAALVKAPGFCRLCSTKLVPEEAVDLLTFEKACDDTLESLSEYFEQIIEEADNLKLGDVSYSSGVLTINLGPKYGTYVINRQTPNRQIWLSSPKSGPKRYDFIVSRNCWVYKHDGQTLHKFLQNEISEIVEMNVDFSNCAYAKF